MRKRNCSPFLVMLTLFWLGWGQTVIAPEPLPSLDDLLKQYQALGLPLPPQEAKLVQYETESGGIVNRKVQPKVHSLAFEVKPGTEAENPFLLRGTHEWQPRQNPHTQEVKPVPAAVQELVLSRDDKLVLTIQCHARGWDKLARHFLESNQKETELPPQTQLIQMAWSYWEGQLTQPKIDRAPVAQRLKEIIRQDNELDTEVNRALLKSLDLALVPSKAKPGSIESLIDDLVDYDADTRTLRGFEPEDPYWRIAILGFDAVPALIEHLEDDRLTRAKIVGFNFSSWHLRVRDVAGDLLEGLAAGGTEDGEDVGGGPLRRQQGYDITKVAASTWWGKAREVGEETYLLDHVLPAEGKEGGSRHISDHILNVIRAKYPKHIPDLYRKVLDKRPELSSWELADAVLQCQLPDQEKLELFLHAAKHQDGNHRPPAFRAIKELDKKQFTAILLSAIEGFPQDVPGPYWTCAEASIAKLVIESDDPRVWPTLERVAKRSAVGLRMELLNNFCDPKDKPYWPERLRLLASFLDDATLRDVDSSNKFDGPNAGFQYHRIEVRDFVALEIAHMLGIDIELNLERTPEEWARIRNQIQEVLERELDKTK